MALRDGDQVVGRIVLVGGEVAEGDREAHQQGVGRLPVLGGEAPARPGIVRALLGAGEPQRVGDAVEPLGRGGTAQDADLERARRALHLGAGQPEAHQRMGEERQHPLGLGVQRRDVGGEAREPPGGLRASGSPAESSATMPQRRSSAATRSASARSG